MKTRWKFLREGMKSQNGSCVWVKGEWKHEESPNMCRRGFHCSRKISDAFSYVHGEILAKVKVKGKSETQDDKDCWTDMCVIETLKWQKRDSVALAIYAAELCIGKFEEKYPDDKRPRQAIEAAKHWLVNPSSTANAAADAAAYAAYAANAAANAAYAAYAADAAAYAAYAAANAAANAANAANAAYAAANAADIRKKISTWMDNRVKELEAL